ncbi:MAG: AsmA family protein [Rhodospirillaceae bacterium]|nr:AsmA family protein [Rhodospirillaceae bacterium]
MRRLLIGLGVIVVLLIVAVVALPFFIPVDWVKEQAQTQAQTATGRQLTIAGDVSLSLFPDVQIKANDVRFANEPGSDVENLVTLKSLALDVALMPLLSGELEIKEFVLIEPVIYLESRADGSANWQFEGQQATTDGGTDGTDGSATSSGGGLADIRLGDVRIENGKVTMHDAATGETTEISAINMALNLADLSSPFAGDGSLTFKGETLTLKIGIDAPNTLLNGGASDVQFKLDSGLMTAGFDGYLVQAGTVSGKVDLSIPSLATLMIWLEQPLDPASPAPDTIKVGGTIEMIGDKISFTGADVAIDDLKASGDVSVDLGGDRPSIVANLVSEMLDLNPYLPQPEENTASAESGDGGSAGGGNTLAEEWSDEEIDFSGLDAANADLTFDLAGLKIQAIEIGRSKLHIVVQNGSATFDLLEAALYGGNGTAHAVIDRSGARPAISKTVSVTGVQAEPLLAAAAGFDRLSGTTKLNLDITTSGSSQLQFMQNLFGNGDFEFADGAFRGANIAAMVRDFSIDSLNAATADEQSTDFSALTGTYTIENGLLTNDDLTLAAPLLRMTGQGNVNMPEKTLDYTIRPKAVASLEGQGGNDDDGVGIPINVRGTWANPSIAPDMEAIAKDALANPENIIDTVEALGVEGLLDGITGGSDGGSLLDSVTGDGDGGGLLDGLDGDSDAGDALESLFD